MNNNERLYAWIASHNNPNIASYRIRCLNIIAALNKKGVNAEVYKRSNHSNYSSIIFSKYYNNDAIKLAQELKIDCKIIFDLSDNHFILTEKKVNQLKHMIMLADCVTVPSRALKFIVEKYCPDTKVIIIEDAFDNYEISKLNKINIKSIIAEFLYKYHFLTWLSKHNSNRTNLIWYGIASGSYENSGIVHLKKKAPILNDINRIQPISLTIVSNSYTTYRKFNKIFMFPVCYLPWSIYTFNKILPEHDICILPIELNEFTIAKSNNRAIQALNNNIPVIADNLDSYACLKDFIKLDDWYNNLLLYINDNRIVARDLEQAKIYINKHYTPEIIAAEWHKILMSPK